MHLIDDPVDPADPVILSMFSSFGISQNRERVAAFFQRAASDSDAVGRAETLPDVFGGGSAGEEILVEADYVAGFAFGLRQQLDAEVAEAAGEERRDDFGCALRDSVE